MSRYSEPQTAAQPVNIRSNWNLGYLEIHGWGTGCLQQCSYTTTTLLQRLFGSILLADSFEIIFLGINLGSNFLAALIWKYVFLRKYSCGYILLDLLVKYSVSIHLDFKNLVCFESYFNDHLRSILL
jgi:hypothetical protein